MSTSPGPSSGGHHPPAGPGADGDPLDAATGPEPVARPVPPVAAWRVVVPVKGGARAKSRLRAPEGVDHGRLATALALDTVATAVATVGRGRVVVVTGDPAIRHAVAALGALVVDDPGTGLDAAITAGVRELDAGPVAALLGDVPSARPDDLAAALAAAGRHDRAFLPDTDGVGTVLLTAATPAGLRPRFGGASARAHTDDGATPLDLDLPRLRRDVDDEDSLRAALCLGVGTSTAGLLAHLLSAPARQASPAERPRSA